MEIIQVNVDNEIRQKADALFSNLGLDTPTAIRIFLVKALKMQGFPFEVSEPRPNSETLVAMLDDMEILPKRYKDFSEVIAEIDDEIMKENMTEK
ncbi:MAG: type II toxin-antitoxin system RelB/DinJ family antitoxin [Ruminococcus sp.]|jgi:DNA-damage-inducible protein J|nr:type II toxin-antitoxin system RelB/DinJ family antitoxin [Ruminococcus sp.]